jgi:phenylacetate-CoA ligase
MESRNSNSLDGLRAWGYTHVIYPGLHPQIYRGLGRRFRQLVRRERLSLAENRECQWRDLIALLRHAQESSPFYNRRFQIAGIRAEELRTPRDLAKIPPLTREDLRDHLTDIYSRRYRREDLQPSATGGTTDTPVPILRNRESNQWKQAIQLRFNSWAGFLPGDKVMYMWGARQDYSQNPSWRWRFYDRYLMRQVWAPTSLFNNEVLDSLWRQFNEFRPRIVYAYPTPLALFCEYVADGHRQIHQPQSAICTAEPLLPEQKRLIEKVLGCPIFEHYGSRDFGMIGAQCTEHRGLHVNPAAAFVEFQPVDGALDSGLQEIFVTDLFNYGMPLIRYKINDCALLGTEHCSCGIGYPLIQQIVGRITDNFSLPNGDVVPGVSLTNRVIQVCPGIRKIQVIQETQCHFRLRYVAGPTFGRDDLTRVREKLDLYFGASITWSFERAEEIPREKSGKTRMCISRVSTSKSDTAHLGISCQTRNCD